MVIRTKKSTATATRTRTAPPAAKKRAVAPAPAKKSVPAKKAVPAQRKAPVKASAPVKAAPPAKRPAPAVTKSAPAPAVQKSVSVTAYDVLRADKAAEIALAHAKELREAFWASQDSALDGAVEHAAKMAEAAEKEVPKKAGRPAAKEGPARKALAAEPKVIDEYYDIDVVKGYGIVQLRELANDLADRGIITERKIKGVIYDQMEEAGLFRQAGTSDADADVEDDDEDGEEGEEDFEEYEDDEAEAADSADDDSDDEEDDGGDDEESLTEDDLNNMPLAELQDLAEKWGISWKNLKQKELVAKIVQEASEDEDSEDEEFEDSEDDSEEYEDEATEDESEGDEDDEEEDDDSEELELSMEDIEAMNAEDLTDLLEKLDVRVPAKIRNNADALRSLLLEHLDEQDDDEEE